MSDPLFRAFLVSTAETLRNQLTDPALKVDEIVEKCKEISRIENRVKRIDNPIPRGPRKTAEAA